MTRPSGFDERNARICLLLEVAPSLRLRDVAQDLGVAEMTLRRDAASGKAGFACQGGYIVRGRSTDAYDFDEQMRRASEAKRVAADHAATLVPDGACVFLDTGTTLPHLARALARGRVRRIVTHCLTSAELLHGRTSAEVEFIGGRLQSRTRSCHPPDPLKVLKPLGIDVGFLSAGGLWEGRELSCSHDYEVAMKRAVIALARDSWAVLDSSKIGDRRAVRFATLDELSGVVTEHGVGRRAVPVAEAD
ncbi:DeoR/GlpR family DNA-binding transcription regulator [Roseivivax marinus]|uniref:DeoR/GlpR family DNA-binding transcription regulator n=1 Tax=Roseivivax marinus TaxID=1379903 RepID=UPI001F0488C6|nr:DeoR/GlpR family DNA-binding transcription regulator [Roseivivax marinus]UMA63447.1 DeoR/GlpR family DNA-binding transcription regulator [Roseivivax marinus]